MKRRGFLRTTAAGLGGLALGPRLSSLAASPAADRLGTIGIQLYTVRGELARDLEGTLARVAAIGFREVEFHAWPAVSAAALRRLLDAHRLAAPSGHIPAKALARDAARLFDTARTLGHRYVVVAWLGAPERRTLDDWKRWAVTFNTAGEAAKRAGIQFCYHNHDFEFAELEGRVPFDLLLEATDPDLVRIELDFYWVTKGDRDPADYLARYPGRFPLVHLKDMDATPARGFADLGQGVLDWKRLLTAARRAGVRHFFYEQDQTPGPVFTSVERSYRYLRGLEFQGGGT